ncbi:MAG TPA: GTPase Era [Bacteroidia bacterium]
MHKSGFVNIIGKPNVGKSTLMNALVGEKLSIITPKAQTTRHRIRGILSGDDFQIVFSDTPGIIKPHYKLHEAMMQSVSDSFSDADVMLYVMEIKDPDPIDEKTLGRLKKSECKVMVLVNKIDTGNQDLLEKKVEEWKTILPHAEIIPVSALEKYNCEYLLKRIIENLPEGPAYFSKDEITDKSQRFFVSEIIREKILLYFRNEIPYCSEVVIDEFKEEEKLFRIRAIIYVQRESQQGIMVGHQGKGIKKIGIEARKDIEAFLGKQVFFTTQVKVEKDWREKESKLRKFGYLE